MSKPHDPAPFDDPWHAQLFALTLALSEAGRFSWEQWTEAFGATLKEHGQAHPLDGSADYYAAWLDTLERLLDAAGLAGAVEARRTKELWERAYRATPHGQPVTLPS